MIRQIIRGRINETIFSGRQPGRRELCLPGGAAAQADSVEAGEKLYNSSALPAMAYTERASCPAFLTHKERWADQE